MSLSADTSQYPDRVRYPAVYCENCRRNGHTTLLFYGWLVGELKCRKCHQIVRGEVLVQCHSAN
jgi:hypothetical protein